MKGNVAVFIVSFFQYFNLMSSFNFSIIKVENIGFEPMTSCMPCKRSSQLS